nr:fatty acid amide hydrolase-like [Tanacetum cinerariifolium]
MRLGKYTEWFNDVFSPEISTKCEDILNLLSETHGCRVVEVVIPELHQMRTSHLLSVGSESLASLTPHCHDGKHKKLTLDTRANLALFRSFTASDYVAAQRLRHRLMYYHMEIFKMVDVIVTPTTGMTAPKIRPSALKMGETNMKVTGNMMRFILAGNLLGLPAISVPVGYDKKGLPIGLQIIGRPWGEATILRLAAAFEVHDTNIVEASFLLEAVQSLVSIRLGLHSQGCLHAPSTSCGPSVCAIRTTYVGCQCTNSDRGNAPLPMQTLLHLMCRHCSIVIASGPEVAFVTPTTDRSNVDWFCLRNVRNSIVKASSKHTAGNSRANQSRENDNGSDAIETIERLQQRIQELEFQQDSPAEEAKTDPNVWDNGSDDVNPFGGGKPRYRDRRYHLRRNDHAVDRDDRYRDDPIRSMGLKIEISEFTGKVHPDDFIDRLSTVEHVFDVRDIPDKLKVKLVAIKLRQHASLWWDHVNKRRRIERKSKVETYGLKPF